MRGSVVKESKGRRCCVGERNGDRDEDARAHFQRETVSHPVSPPYFSNLVVLKVEAKNVERDCRAIKRQSVALVSRCSRTGGLGRSRSGGSPFACSPFEGLPFSLFSPLETHGKIQFAAYQTQHRYRA